VIEAVRMGMVGFVKKSMPAATLVEVVRNIARGDIWVPHPRFSSR